jgi:MoaA/NifB/PqqE/SkfB family radical SAM enzyme
VIDIRKITHGYWWNAQKKFEMLVNNETSKLFELTMQITDRCNLNCPKCNRINFTFEDMKLTDIIRIITEAKALGLKHIHFTGGEATLHPNFIEIIELCKIKDLRVDMSTNGIFSASYEQTLLASGIDSVNVSWDFVDVVPECFTRKQSNKRKILWFINHMVMPSNFLELPAFLKMIKEQYPYVVDIQLMPPRGTADKFTKDQILQFNELIPECMEISKFRYPMVEFKLNEILADPRADEGIYHQEIKWQCHRSKTELRVGTKGFSTCTYLYRDGHVTCDLSKSVAEAWQMCKEECASAPPQPKMCPYSCSPEVVNFNKYVEEAI